MISISGDLKIQKPDERIFQLTIEQLGCKPEDCLYVDDREGNLESASKVGMNAVLLIVEMFNVKAILLPILSNL